MTGLAVVRTRRGKTYIGHATVADGLVSMDDARLRHKDMQGMRFYAPAPRSWPRSEWAEIRWIDRAAREAIAA